MKSFDSLNIVPALHRNTIAFIGMGKRSSYLATKVIKDKFIALDYKNYLFCWSIVTGKLLEVTRLPPYQDFSEYKVYFSKKDSNDFDTEYKREWYNKILLVKNTPETLFNQRTFFDPEGSHTQLTN
jgi:hypothetical protein